MERNKMEFTAEELETISYALGLRSAELQAKLDETIRGLQEEMNGDEYDSMWFKDTIEVVSGLFDEVKRLTILSLRTKADSLPWKDRTAE